ncbi:cell division protein FtsQ/DivIB [Sphingomonas nostoxanthinifaciens]|uniref:cell division protein FtsQ/DivIB n=1 Tax=Sphingomonas nostoxanthinifaciens TaxID=2872652 RepID=UPI001CC215F7|nr:FtsQ-type POTRA domain-containing protein [Sphingomonas nostoxanthinifaciens]
MSRAPARGRAATATRRPATRIAKPARRRRPTLRAQMGRALERFPIPYDLLRRVRDWTLGLLVAAALIAGVIAMGLPQMAGMAVAHALGQAGFVVRNIQISGRSHVDRDAVYRIVMDARGQDMPLVDLGAMRKSLLGLGWIADARVSRRLPDTLSVDIVERAPAAILQRNQVLSLIDDDGHVLAAVDPHLLPVQLPLVIGPGVEQHIAEFRALIAGQPSLKTLVAGGTWVGDRRWDLRFQSGETLMLPEGVEAAQAALANFVRRDSQERLLGQGYVHFDMRDGQHLVVRTTTDPGTKITEPTPAAPADPSVAPPPVAGAATT